MFTLEDGEAAVRAARQAILEGPRVAMPARFDEKGGVFVTLHTHPKRELRGCVGYPMLVEGGGGGGGQAMVRSHVPGDGDREAVPDAARAAAFRDTRFAPVERAEMATLVVEVSLLTRPRRLAMRPPREIAAQVEVGRHGLMVDRGMLRGILLPQVAVEHGWDAGRFLSEACLKAGLMPDAWLTGGTEVSVFEAFLFEEREPGGAVEPVALEG